MKKIITKIALGTLLCVGALQICAKTEKRAQAEMKPEYLMFRWTRPIFLTNS